MTGDEVRAIIHELDACYTGHIGIDIVLTHEEAEEFYRFMVNQYLNPNDWPHLRRLVERVDAARKEAV